MTDRSKTLEVMARAHHEKARKQYFMPPWDDLGSSQHDLCSLMEAALTAYESHLQAEGMAVVAGWQPIESAPKDGTVIWALLRNDIYPGMHPQRDDLKRWNGLQVPLRHPGVATDGFDIGWNLAAPVGHGGFPDEWIAGWMPLPAASPYGKAVVKEKDDE